MRGKILLIDDDPGTTLVYESLLASRLKDASVSSVNDFNKITCALEKETPNVVVLDLCLCPKEGVESGFKKLKEIIDFDSSIRVIVLTGHSSDEYGVRAIHSGAASFLSKPVNEQHLVALIQDGIKQSKLRKDYSKLIKNNLEIKKFLCGKSSSNQELIKSLEFAASTDQTVLITGETGTGKGYCAKIIHKFSKRKNNNFVSIQPIYNSPELTASELFGHQKGSFTGADYSRNGLLAKANCGTLFLDEIDSFSPEIQASLLGVLQDKKYRPIGLDQESSSDFRLISATNQNIEKAIETKRLRQDLYFRLAHLRIDLKPLRERVEDIPELTTSILQKTYLKVRAISDSALERLALHDWPGNIRELEFSLQAAAERASFLGKNIISEKELNLNTLQNFAMSPNNFHKEVKVFKGKLVQSALRNNNNSQVRAAKELGIDRGTLRRIIESTS